MPDVQHKRNSQEILLLRQWFAAILKPYEYLTLVVPTQHGENTLQAFQLLDLERRNIITRPFVDATETQELEGLYVVSLQPLEIWEGGRVQHLLGRQQLDTFVLEEPTKVDIIAASGGALESRHFISVWQAKLSDIDGCVELHSPQRLVESRAFDLMGKKPPVLALLDALSAKGFAGVDRAVVHMEGVQEYDRRQLSGRRAYLQCVLHSVVVLTRGVTEFRSTGPASYYEALLRAKGNVVPGLPSAAYKRHLAADEGDALALAELEDHPLVPKAAPKPKRKQARPARAKVAAAPPAPIQDMVEDSEDASVFGGASDDEQRLAVVVASAAGCNEGAVIGASEPGAEVAIAPGPAHAPLGPEAPEGVPSFIFGQKVQFVPGRCTASHTYSDRLSIRCDNSSHINCSKSRSLDLLRDRLGPRCAEAFLGAWLAKSDSLAKTAHTKYAPRIEDMRAYLAEHP